MTLDKSSALRSLLVVAWRQRMTDLQFSIKLKEILPRGCTGDVYGLSGLILNAALLSPLTPNKLLLGYLEHALATQTVSHAALLQAVAAFNDGVGNSTSKDLKKGPFCLQALLNLAKLSLNHVTSRGKPEECLNLATSLLKTLHWLLKIVHQGIISEVNSSSTTSAAAQKTEIRNIITAKTLAQFMMENEFTLCMMFIGRIEDKDTYAKILNTNKKIMDQLKGLTQQNQLSHSILSECPKFKPNMTRLVTCISAGSLDPLSQASMEFVDGAIPNQYKQPSSAQAFLAKSNHLPSLVHVIQPLLLFEAIMRPMSDLKALSQNLMVMSTTHNVPFSNLIYEVLRGMLISVAQRPGLQTLKVDAFVMIKLPLLLEKLYHLHLKQSSSYDASVSQHPLPPLKTPTDTYKAFDKLLKNESFLDAKDSCFKCNILQLLLQVVGKCSVPLLTDTEREDILKRRSTAKSNSRIKTDNFPEEFVGTRRNFDYVLKAESKDILGTLIKAMDAVDLARNPESIESVLDNLIHIVAVDSFNLLLVTSAASSSPAKNKLKSFIKTLVKVNQASQESQGESVKNSLLRSALFDVTFLMIVHIVQCFGIDIVLAAIQQNPSDATLSTGGSLGKPSFLQSWLTDMWMGRGTSNTRSVDPLSKGKVDNLLQQLINGDLRTQVVKWQDICTDAHSVFSEVLSARSQGMIDQAKYDSITSTLCSKVCSLPVCVMTWLAKQTAQVTNLPDIARGLAEMAEKSLIPGQHSKERLSLMQSILNKMLMETGFKSGAAHTSSDYDEFLAEGEVKNFVNLTFHMSKPSTTDEYLKEHVRNVWKEKVASGFERLSSETAWKLHTLYRVGGASWYVATLVEELLKTVYHTDLDKYADLVVSFFNVDIEQCTLVLLLDVLPSYIQGHQKREKLADPHGSALARLLIGAICSAFAVTEHQSTGSSAKLGKRNHQMMSSSIESDADGFKVRRVMGMTVTVTEFPLSGMVDSGCVKKGEEPTTLQRALWGFFKLVHAVIMNQEYAITPVTHFAYHILELAAFMSGLQSGPGVKGTVGQNQTPPQPPPSSSPMSKSAVDQPVKHVLQHIGLNLILHLVKVVPYLFTSYGIVTKFFDVGQQPQAARKNATRVLCLLRNISNRSSMATKLKKIPPLNGHSNRTNIFGSEVPTRLTEPY